MSLPLRIAPVVIGLALVAPRAWAEPSRDPAAAEVLFRQGRMLVQSGQYGEACRAFAESYRLDPAPGALLNLADCEEHTGKLASAWQHFHQLFEGLPPTDRRYPVAEERAARLEPRLPRLAIALGAGAPPGTKVLRDGVELAGPSLGIALPVDPGDHIIVVVAPDHAPFSTQIRVDEGVREALDVGPGPALPPSEIKPVPEEPPPPIVAAAPPPDRSSATQRAVGWTVGAFGVASLGVATYFGLRAIDRLDTSNQSCMGHACTTPEGVEAYRDAQAFSRTADVALGVGVVSLGVAGYLLLTARDTPVQPRVGLGPRGASVGLGGAF